MPVKGFDAREEFAVVAAGDQDLCVLANRRLKDGERAGRELIFLELGDFVLGQLVAGLLQELSVSC